MLKKIKILIVEDDEDERIFMKEGFRSTGLFDIVADVSNGDEMLKLIRNSANLLPEVIVLDLNMPGKDGYDILAEMKKHSSLSQIPVVVVSGAPKKPFGYKCKHLGAISYFNKPHNYHEYSSFAKTLYNSIVNEAVMQ